MKKFIFTSITALVLLAFPAVSQEVAITDDASYTASPSAMLDVKSLTKGLLMPRLTTTQMNAISNPAKGLMVFVTTDSSFYFYDGTAWVDLLSSRTPITGVAYAQVYTVAQSGGDFSSIQSAIGACLNPSPSNRFLVRVMPGTYTETVTCSKYVTLQGAGKYSCHIQGQVIADDSCTITCFFIEEGIQCQGVSPTITDNLITNTSGIGVDITLQGKPWIVNNEIVDCTSWGIHCNGWGADAWIIGNKIMRNIAGGIRCSSSSPTISNNEILEDHNYGIYMIGVMDFPTEPTISDNQIGLIDPNQGGRGIFMTGFAEPRIIANDIYVNYTGIDIQPSTQPSITGNNINYNHHIGIICSSSGASKPVTIMSNHVHSNWTSGIQVLYASPIITHNNINDNGSFDIEYFGPPTPNVSLNVFDNSAAQTGIFANGNYNVDRLGNPINP